MQNQTYVDPKDNKTKTQQVNVSSNVFKQATISRLGQDVIGAVRIHTAHTNQKLCRSPKEFNMVCYDNTLNG